jgi:hypothetical protein
MRADARKGLARIAAAAAAALLGGGCACETVRCSIADQDSRPFGTRTARFVRDLQELPGDVHDEFVLRGDRLGVYAETWGEGRAREVDLTMGHVTGLPGAIADDFREHGGALVDTLGDAVTRTNEDVCCFFPRAWHVIRLALE